MDPLTCDRRQDMESYLLKTHIGFEVLDAIVQANLDLTRLTQQDLELFTGQVGHDSSYRPH